MYIYEYITSWNWLLTGFEVNHPEACNPEASNSTLVRTQLQAVQQIWEVGQLGNGEERDVPLKCWPPNGGVPEIGLPVVIIRFERWIFPNKNHPASLGYPDDSNLRSPKFWPTSTKWPAPGVLSENSSCYESEREPVPGLPMKLINHQE